MATYERRQFLFWSRCLVLRIFICAFICFSQTRIVQTLLAIYMGSWGLGFLFNFSKQEIKKYKIRMKYKSTVCDKTLLQNEIDEYGDFGGLVWWQELRLFHGILLVAYAISTFISFYYAFVFAILDIFLAISAGLYHYLLRRIKIVYRTTVESE